MIYNVKGEVTYVDATFVVIECNGVGFKCFASMTTLKNMPAVGNVANLYTYLAVREDAMDLYGFATQDELDVFKLLITVSGIGPKAAMAILSVLSPDKLAIAISAGDIKAIQAAQGVGKKTAERVVLELKDKMIGVGSEQSSQITQNIIAASSSSNAQEAVEVLTTLGFNQSDAAVVVGGMDKSLSVDDMVRLGLKQLSSQL